MEQAVRGAEEFMRLPFPVNDVIMMSVKHSEEDPQESFLGRSAIFERTHVKVRSNEGSPIGRFTVYHELAHYFFPRTIGPVWISEGSAELVKEYVFDLVGHTVMETRLLESEETATSFCREQGIENISDLLHAGDRDPQLILHCPYHLGRYFLLSLYYTIGHEALTAALAEMHLNSARYEGGMTEEEIYLTILNHTPADLKDELQAVYRDIHGGPFTGQAN